MIDKREKIFRDIFCKTQCGHVCNLPNHQYPGCVLFDWQDVNKKLIQYKIALDKLVKKAKPISEICGKLKTTKPYTVEETCYIENE
jgi:hypothetical protein